MHAPGIYEGNESEKLGALHPRYLNYRFRRVPGRRLSSVCMIRYSMAERCTPDAHHPLCTLVI